MRAIARFRGRAIRELQRHHDVFQRGQGRDELKRLEDEADVRRTKPRAFILGKTVQVLPVERYTSRAGPVEAGEQTQQCGLAAARRPDDRHKGFRLDVQIH